jgi:hypothetical protein
MSGKHPAGHAMNEIERKKKENKTKAQGSQRNSNEAREAH